jgi:SAM-dependent methyltransferase
MIEELPRVIEEAPDRPVPPEGAERIRAVAREIAFAPESWTRERAAKVAGLFDGMASEWSARRSITSMEPLRDALARGRVPTGLCVELGSGTGSASSILSERFHRVVSMDLSMEMLRHAPIDGPPRVCADGARLPLPDRAARVLVLVNAFLFPSEVDRVLASDGVVVWVSSLADRTPIYLPAEDVARALPGSWSGSAALAGWGSWCVLTRDEV